MWGGGTEQKLSAFCSWEALKVVSTFLKYLRKPRNPKIVPKAFNCQNVGPPRHLWNC